MHKQSFKALVKWEYLNDIWKISEVSQKFRFHRFSFVILTDKFRKVS
jgi:hypothetical protein